MVARDEIIMKEVVVGLADGLQQARALLPDQRATVQPQGELVQPLLCIQAAGAQVRATRSAPSYGTCGSVA